jgi:hypothetical protein
MNSKNTIKYLLIVFISLLPLTVSALPNPGDDPDSSVPIDGGASLLVGSAILYGVKKMKDRRKK